MYQAFISMIYKSSIKSNSNTLIWSFRTDAVCLRLSNLKMQLDHGLQYLGKVIL